LSEIYLLIMKKIVIFLFGVTVFISVGRFYLNNETGEMSNDSTDIVQSLVKDGCTRENRLDNEPQYDRALSLIQQRIDENERALEVWKTEGILDEDGEENLRFGHFPANLANCIKIIEKDIDSNEEGYFIFNDEDIRPNYFPITVNSRYVFADNVLASMLIVHEMSHVQQYINSLSKDEDSSCRDQEVSAFISQLDFYVLLNNEENYAFWLRMNDDKNDKHPQVAIIETMIAINRESSCNIMDFECKDKNLRNELFKLISEDKTYQHQCDF